VHYLSTLAKLRACLHSLPVALADDFADHVPQAMARLAGQTIRFAWLRVWRLYCVRACGGARAGRRVALFWCSRAMSGIVPARSRAILRYSRTIFSRLCSARSFCSRCSRRHRRDRFWREVSPARDRSRTERASECGRWRQRLRGGLDARGYAISAGARRGMQQKDARTPSHRMRPAFPPLRALRFLCVSPPATRRYLTCSP